MQRQVQNFFLLVLFYFAGKAVVTINISLTGGGTLSGFEAVHSWPSEDEFSSFLAPFYRRNISILSTQWHELYWAHSCSTEDEALTFRILWELSCVATSCNGWIAMKFFVDIPGPQPLCPHLMSHIIVVTLWPFLYGHCLPMCIGCIVMKFAVNINAPQRMNCTGFSDPVAFPLVPPLHQRSHLHRRYCLIWHMYAPQRKVPSEFSEKLCCLILGPN